MSSQYKHKHIWKFHIGNKNEGKCFSCGKILFKDHNIPGNKWQCGHIIKKVNNGPDFLENIVPLCVSCNSKDRKYDTTFEYMLNIGTLTIEEFEEKKKSFLSKIEYINKNLQIRKCIQIKKDGERCNYLKREGEFCGLHYKCNNKRIQKLVQKMDESAEFYCKRARERCDI